MTKKPALTEDDVRRIAREEVVVVAAMKKSFTRDAFSAPASPAWFPGTILKRTISYNTSAGRFRMPSVHERVRLLARILVDGQTACWVYEYLTSDHYGILPEVDLRNSEHPWEVHSHPSAGSPRVELLEA